MLREQKVIETMPDGEYILKVCPGLVVQSSVFYSMDTYLSIFFMLKSSDWMIENLVSG